MKTPRENHSFSPEDHLLLADGNDNESYHIAVLLQRFKYRVVTVKTAAQVLASITESMPHLVISTQTLHDMDASDLIARLNELPGAADVPVIVLGQAYDVGTEEHVRNAGAAAYLTTPIVPEDLYCAVQSAIETTPRENIRIVTRLPVAVDGVPLDYEKGEYVSMLSEQGLHVNARMPQQGKTLHSVLITINDRVISVIAKVLYRQPSRDGLLPQTGMGLKFVRISPEDRQFIKQHVREEVMKGVSGPGRKGPREEAERHAA